MPSSSSGACPARALSRRTIGFLATELALAALITTSASVHLLGQSTPPVTITNVALEGASGTLTVGAQAYWSASATGGTAPLQFKFWLHDETSGDWTMLQDYSSSTAVSWVPAATGSFRVQVWVRSAGSSAPYEAWQNSDISSVAGILSTTVISLKATPSPGSIATPVMWTAMASGGVPPLQYKFWIQNETTGVWSLLQEFSPQNQARWTPTAAGAYTAQVWVRSAQSSGQFEALRNSAFLVQAPGTTARVSVATGEGEAIGFSGLPSVSASGRFVSFYSYASNLVAGDTNNAVDVFVRNLATGTTERVSVGTGGTQAEGSSDYSSISADGRFVAFYSIAPNLVNGDTNDQADVFVRDRQTNTTTRISVADDGTQSDSLSDTPSISADGRYVAFMSMASNLVRGDTNFSPDIFVHDRGTATTTRVSMATGSMQGNGGSYSPSISADGRFVAFESDANNLVPGDTNRTTDVFVRDRQAGTTERISNGLGGVAANGGSYSASISGDGRFVAFVSLASNLVSGDTNAASDIFVYDRLTSRTTRVSIAADGTQTTSSNGYPSISADGRFVTFSSRCTNLVSGDTNGAEDVFVYDRTSGTTARMSVNTAGAEGNSESYGSFLGRSISGDGRIVAFDSGASNLVASDTNSATDVFVRQRGETVAATVLLVSPELAAGASGTNVVWTAYATGGTAPLEYQFWLYNSTAGTWQILGTGYTSSASIAWTPTVPGTYMVQAWVRSSGSPVGYEAWGNSAPLTIPGPTPPVLTSVTHNVGCPATVGRWISTTATAIGGASPLQYKMLLYDETASSWTVLQEYSSSNRVSWLPTHVGAFYLQAWVRSAGSTAPYEAVLNSASCTVTFPAPVATVTLNRSPNSSPVSDLTSVYWYAMASGGTPPLEYKFVLRNDATGVWSVVADYGSATTVSTSLAAGNYLMQVWVRSKGSPAAYDVWAGLPVRVVRSQTTRASVATGEIQALGASDRAAISADGRFVAFDSDAGNLVGGDTNGEWDVFVRDRQTATTTRVSVATGGVEGFGSSYSAAISADGRFVAFASDAPNLVADDANGATDIFVHDRSAATTTRVSVATSGAEANGSSFNPAISADGRFVAFASDASNLVAGDTNAASDIFVVDRQTNTTTRVSVAAGDIQANGGSYAAAISADGRFVAFDSDAWNLVPGDTNGSSDVFVRDRQAGTTTRASVSSAGTQGFGNSYSPSISADGQLVAFNSAAPDLVSNDTNLTWDVFVWNRSSGNTTRVSVSDAGGQGNDASWARSISADGRFVGFSSQATNLIVGGDPNSTWDVFLRDLQGRTTRRVSVSSFDGGTNDASYAPSLSGDGHLIAFTSLAAYLVSNDTNNSADIFVRDTGEPGAASVQLISYGEGRWTIYASGGTAALEYKFYLYNSATGSWTVLRDWGISNTTVWVPPGPGTYTLQGWVRVIGSSAPYDAWLNSTPVVVP